VGKRKKSLVGWVVRRTILKYRRADYLWGDLFDLRVFRGNPNPKNITKTNNWKKVRITLEKI
jgi:hypothetical protein